MLSTTLTVTDAYPRTLTQSFVLLLPKKLKKYQQSQYFFWIIILSAGTYLLISIPGNSMHFLVDLATSIAFVTAPFLALLNYYVITSANIPKQFQPARYLRIWSWIGIAFLSLFTAYYVYMLIKG
jgi:Mn2+/Fe2+ NRAMP family transporter